MEIRPARESDLAEVAAIYGREAHEGHATFDVDGRSVQTWRDYLGHGRRGDHFLVAVDDGSVVGFAYAARYRPKPGYDTTRETTVYVVPTAQGRGVGTALYSPLLELLADDHIHLALAGVALPNDASRALHATHGFEPVGVMREVGRKLDRWVDVEWWQRRLR